MQYDDDDGLLGFGTMREGGGCLVPSIKLKMGFEENFQIYSRGVVNFQNIIFNLIFVLFHATMVFYRE